MAKQSGTKEVTKTSLLEAGCRIMREKGYSNTGIQEVLDSTGVPKGSFYYYFDSKEDFALQIIDHFDKTYSDQLRVFLEDKGLKPIERLKAYCDEGRRNLVLNNCSKGCLIGNLSQEMSDQSETLRKELSEVMARRVTMFARCIEEGQTLGEITKVGSAEQLALFFISSLSGALMSAKTVKTIDPIDTFIDLMFNHFLKA